MAATAGPGSPGSPGSTNGAWTAGVPAATAWSIRLATAGTAAAEGIPWTRALSIVVPADAASEIASGIAVAVR